MKFSFLQDKTCENSQNSRKIGTFKLLKGSRDKDLRKHFETTQVRPVYDAQSAGMPPSWFTEGCLVWPPAFQSSGTHVICQPLPRAGMQI